LKKVSLIITQPISTKHNFATEKAYTKPRRRPDLADAHRDDWRILRSAPFDCISGSRVATTDCLIEMMNTFRCSERRIPSYREVREVHPFRTIDASGE
jgi:hypothetical protein